MDKKTKKILVIVGIVLLVLLIWGLIGANQVDGITNRCTLGSKDSLCWLWENTIVGDIADKFSR